MNNADEVDTPALLLDLNGVERNITAMASRFARRRLNLRPHTKTHKSPALALRQLAAGAVGVCCAKVSEAEVMAAGGVSPILVTTPIVGVLKIRRLLGVARQAEVLTVVDHLHPARALSDAAVRAGLSLGVLIDVDVGQQRTGVAPGSPALALAEEIERLPGLRLVGLQGFDGQNQHIADWGKRSAAALEAVGLLTDTAQAVRHKGLDTSIVTTGGTGTCDIVPDDGLITDIQAGSYVVMDAEYSQVAGVGFDHALSVLVTVISKSERGVIVDAGHKGLSTDSETPRPKSLPATYLPLGDEHGMLHGDGTQRLPLGQKLEILPGHCDTTINLYDSYHVMRDGVLVGTWPISARGCIQ